MNISNLATELKFVNKIGQTLSSEECIKLDLAVNKLSQEYYFEMFNFWGRVEGIHKNYYIVEGITFKGASCTPKKQHFWSSDDFKFAEMPAPRTDFIARVNKMDDFFTGQHEKILLKSFEDIMKLKNFTELDRLSVVVHQIEDECRIVPLGAFKMIPTHELVTNPNFQGLKIDKSKNLCNYVHLRQPKLCEKKLLIGTYPLIQKVERPSNVIISLILSVKMKSSKAGPFKQTNQGLRQQCEVWFGQGMLVTTGQILAYLEECTWATGVVPKTFLLLFDGFTSFIRCYLYRQDYYNWEQSLVLMTDFELKKNFKENSNIVIEEEERSYRSGVQPSIEEIIETQPPNNHFKKAEQIKINRQKLLKYAALTEKSINKPLEGNNLKPRKVGEDSILMKTAHLDRTPSHPTLRQIKHKITHNNSKVKINENKENQCSPLFPRMNTKGNESRNFLNKTTSAISFKGNKGQSSNIALRESESTNFNSKMPHNLSRTSGKSSTGRLKVANSQKEFNKTSSLSKFRYLNTQENHNEMSVDHSEVMNALTNINDKQEQLLLTRKLLEEKVKQLKGNIQRQHNLLQDSMKNKQKIASSMTRQQSQSRHSLDGAKIYKRKFETCQTESKHMEGKINEITECNSKVVQAIDEEKQLIGMYESVIEELRGQLKVEKEERSELQKKLLVSKKTLKNVETKASSQQNNTRQLFQKVFISLDRWQ